MPKINTETPQELKEKEALLQQRRGTIVEQAAEGFIEEKQRMIEKTEANKKSLVEKLRDVGNVVYNHETRQFVGRDGKACFQLSLFYFIFYTILSATFIGLLAIFASTLDAKEPRYSNQQSVMNYAKVNPSLGFRPQYNPEDALIFVNVSNTKRWREEDVHTLETFLDKYENLKGKVVKILPDVPQRVVQFDYNKIIEKTDCSKEKSFGFAAGKPCIALKMNKIYGWKPQPFAEPPKQLNVQIPNSLKGDNKTSYLDRYVYVHCDGEQPFDKDNIGKISYYSLYPSNNIGGFPAKFYPYRNQENYLAPLVFVQFENLTRNVLVNIECKLYARNIDNEDRRNQRGMVRFEIFLTK